MTISENLRDSILAEIKSNYFIVDESCKIHFSNIQTNYLSLMDGLSEQEQIVQPELRELIEHAFHGGNSVSTGVIRQYDKVFSIKIKFLKGDFNEQPLALLEISRNYSDNDFSSDREEVQLLKDELKRQEANNQELQNELYAMNEELVRTSHELVSLNEEVYQINSELNDKINQLNKRIRRVDNEDVDIFIQNAQLDMIALDPKGKVTKFTPLAENLFPEIEKNREIFQLQPNFECADFEHFVSQGLEHKASFGRISVETPSAGCVDIRRFYMDDRLILLIIDTQ